MSAAPPLTLSTITSHFKLRNLTIQRQACLSVLNVLTREAEPLAALNTIIQKLKESKHGGVLKSGSVVTNDMMERIVSELTQDEKDVKSQSLEHIPYPLSPIFNSQNQAWSIDDPTIVKRSYVDEDIGKRIEMFRRRLENCQQRIDRHDLFERSSNTNTKNGMNSGIKLETVESLLGRKETQNKRIFLLGLIVRTSETTYSLEDLTGQMRLNLTESIEKRAKQNESEGEGDRLQDGYICENCIVLVEGHFNYDESDTILNVDEIGPPPFETRDSALSNISLNVRDKLTTVLDDTSYRENDETMFIVISDLHLDKPNILNNLDLLLKGFEDVTPSPVFVLMGNFQSKPLSLTSGPYSIKSYTNNFNNMVTNIVENYTTLAENAKFIIIPGPMDPGVGSSAFGSIASLPRGPLPTIVSKATEGLKHCVLGCNPCRLRFFDREMVFFREEGLRKLQRCSILPITTLDPEELTRNVLKTYIDQGCLSPLPLTISPINFSHAASLSLYPPPSFLIVGQSAEKLMCSYGGKFDADEEVLEEGVVAVSTAGFEEGRFVVITPGNGVVEFSNV